MNESGKEDGVINMNDSVNVGKLLPITPKPKTTHNTNTTPLPYSTNCIHTRNTNNVVGLNGHLGNKISEQNRREFHEEPLMGSSRWNPTAEQLLALEEMYRRGTRTPTADQIQQIASQLRRFGKIEGKNVFYWFQNHKARERQKRRREAETSRKLPKHDHVETLHNQDSGMRAVFQLELKRTLSLSVPPSYCCENLEGPFSMHRTATAESTITKNGWSQLEEKIFHHHKDYTWHDMDLYLSSPIQFINNMNTTRTSSRFLNFQNKNASFKPRWIETDETNNVDEDRVTEEVELVETLELFPLCSSSEESEGLNNINDREVPIRAINTKMNNPNQYFEFLPVKK